MTVCVFSYASFIGVISQAQTFQEDFEQERKDRENEHGKVVEIEERYKHQVESMVKQLSETAQDLQNHKETLATTETVMHSKLEQLSDLLCEKNLEMAAIVAKNDHLQEEVLSKTQQVEQYKKQVDQYKQEVGALKQSAQMEIQQVHTCITGKKNTYRGVTKEYPLPTFSTICCIGLKLTWMSARQSHKTPLGTQEEVLVQVHWNGGKHNVVVVLPVNSLIVDQAVDLRPVETSAFITASGTEGCRYGLFAADKYLAKCTSESTRPSFNLLFLRWMWKHLK